MSPAVEQTVGDVTVRIDRLLCVGFGDCIDEAPELFEFDGEGIVVFKAPIPDIGRERLLTACDICPVDALEVRSTDGEQLVP